MDIAFEHHSAKNNDIFFSLWSENDYRLHGYIYYLPVIPKMHRVIAMKSKKVQFEEAAIIVLRTKINVFFKW